MMSAKRKLVVGVIFGGRSVEHDVSIITANQIMRAFSSEYYEVVPIYITRDGRWVTGAPLWELKNYQNEIISQKGMQEAILSPATHHHGLIINPLAGRFSKSNVVRLDVVFPSVHGSHGEDGTLQGLFELADIPYVGCAVLSSALTNDKTMTKRVLAAAGLPVLESVLITRAHWEDASDTAIAEIGRKIGYPLFVKPNTLGSSIGVMRANDEAMLRVALDVATNFDSAVLVERAAQNPLEINCAVMGNGDQIEASLLEQPLSLDEFLTFREKYERGEGGMKGADRIIPAAVPQDLTARLRQLAVDAFRAVGGRGTARLDFLLEGDTVYVNEINTMPGSLAFYLWREQGMSAANVVERLVQLAQNAYAEKRRNTYNYQTDLIKTTAARGHRGLKGSKSNASTSSAVKR
jgi:D-alanine-D-alanine ligase